MYDAGECMGCFVNKKLLDLAYETKHFVVAQDCELPIKGFIIITSKRHIYSINEMTSEEKTELVLLIDKILKALKELNVCERYNVIWEEKEGNHFHVWLMPRHKWMVEKFGNPTRNITKIFEYAKQNLRSKENINEIDNCIKLLKQKLN